MTLLTPSLRTLRLLTMPVACAIGVGLAGAPALAFSPAAPATASTLTGAPLPGSSPEPAPATPVPTATPHPNPDAPAPSPAPTPASPAKPLPTPSGATPADTTETPTSPARSTGPGAGALVPVDSTLQPDTVPISESLQATTIQLGGPSLSIRAVSKALSRRAPTSLKVKYTSAGARSIEVWLLLPSTSSTTTLARTTVSAPGTGTASLQLGLSKHGRGALERSGRRTAILRLVGTNAAGITTTVERRVAIVRSS